MSEIRADEAAAAPPISDIRPRPVPAASGLAPGVVADWLAWGQQALAAESDSARADAEILLAALLDVNRSTLPIRRDEAIEAATVLRYASWIERRRLGEPVAYITGRQGFWSIDLAVDTAVLIPRPDTETLVAWALERARARSPATPALAIADLGTGSGAIALALAHELPESVRIVATDRSADALAVAQENARALDLERVEFLLGDWFEPLAQSASSEPRRFDLIVSNPPYIAEGDAHLAALRFEPRLALSCGPDGLDALRILIREAPRHLNAGGWLLLEHGHDQADAVCGLLREAGFEHVGTRRDFGGNERVSGGMHDGRSPG